MIWMNFVTVFSFSSQRCSGWEKSTRPPASRCLRRPAMRGDAPGDFDRAAPDAEQLLFWPCESPAGFEDEVQRCFGGSAEGGVAGLLEHFA